VVIRNHHQGFIDWETFEAKQMRLAENMRPACTPGRRRGQRRRGAAAGYRFLRTLRARLLQQAKIDAQLLFAGNTINNGRGEYCLRVGGRQIDDAVAVTFLAVLTPAGLEAALKAAEQLESDYDGAFAQFRQEVERAV
jgi:hypothetical protein